MLPTTCYYTAYYMLRSPLDHLGRFEVPTPPPLDEEFLIDTRNYRLSQQEGGVQKVTKNVQKVSPWIGLGAVRSSRMFKREQSNLKHKHIRTFTASATSAY